MVTGVDTERWTAYGLVENYYDGHGGKDHVNAYAEEWTEKLQGDPLTRGRDDAKNPIWCPRHYFLRVVEIRTEQAYDEWRVVAEVMAEKMTYGVS